MANETERQSAIAFLTPLVELKTEWEQKKQDKYKFQCELNRVKEILENHFKDDEEKATAVNKVKSIPRKAGLLSILGFLFLFLGLVGIANVLIVTDIINISFRSDDYALVVLVISLISFLLMAFKMDFYKVSKTYQVSDLNRKLFVKLFIFGSILVFVGWNITWHEYLKDYYDNYLNKTWSELFKYKHPIVMFLIVIGIAGGLGLLLTWLTVFFKFYLSARFLKKAYKEKQDDERESVKEAQEYYAELQEQAELSARELADFEEKKLPHLTQSVPADFLEWDKLRVALDGLLSQRANSLSEAYNYVDDVFFKRQMLSQQSELESRARSAEYAAAEAKRRAESAESEAAYARREAERAQSQASRAQQQASWAAHDAAVLNAYTRK
ncbi:hypothetical protein [uncultured Actinobacillus sp.]|uniref:hypothetical protein n=1 Tax=uncultured Actinobacillus sp. TaxID=417616 RepID=UPI0025EE5F42|nr:hypothetical protein [uncultured Actinobacillus sp.]